MRRLAFTTRLTLGAAALVFASLSVFTACALWYFRFEQFEQVDIELEAAVAARFAEDGLPEGLQPYMQMAHYDNSGDLVQATSRFPADLVRLAAEAETKPLTVANPPPGWRLLSRKTADGGVLIGAYDLDEVRDVTMDMVKACLVALPLLAVLSAVGAWLLARRSLGELRALTTAVSGVAARRLDLRVPVPEARDDIRRLAQAFNEMLARLESGFEQAQRFSADASHELRTPLTIMRGEIASLLRAPDISPAVEARLASLQEEIGRLERITEHLLLLARFDAGEDGRAERAELDFAVLVAECHEDAEVLASARDVTLERETVEVPPIRGDALLLRRLVLNLLDNATRYNLPGGRVRCALRLENGSVALRVANTGSPVDLRGNTHLFRRFHRADAARARGGHGLGLALSREIARSHGGELRLADDPPDGMTEFVLTLPPANKGDAPGGRR